MDFSTIDAPEAIRQLLKRICSSAQNALNDDLVGVYLHGSLAMGCFNPSSSDIDFLVVSKRKLSFGQKEELIEALTRLSEQAPPKGLEMSVVSLSSLKEFEYPTPFELHFSNSWLERYRAGKVTLMGDRKDPDLAAHFYTIRERGITLLGEPLDKIFSKIPEQYYLASICADAEEILNDITKDPVYGVLNLCRVLAYKKKGLVTSKVEGGQWAIDNLPSTYQPTIKQALDEYRGRNMKNGWDKQALNDFARYAKEQIAT